MRMCMTSRMFLKFFIVSDVEKESEVHLQRALPLLSSSRSSADPSPRTALNSRQLGQLPLCCTEIALLQGLGVCKMRRYEIKGYTKTQGERRRIRVSTRTSLLSVHGLPGVSGRQATSLAAARASLTNLSRRTGFGV